MKIDINVAILAYIRSQGLNLSSRDFGNLILAIHEQMDEGEVKKHVEAHIGGNNRQKV